MLSRREVLRQLANVPLVGGFFGGLAPGFETEGSASQLDALDEEYHEYFHELGIRTFINAQGRTHTTLTGSLMPPEVRKAWNFAARHYVELDEIRDKTGERLAELGRSEAAMVTAGAASALTLAAAAVVAGTDEEKIQKIPNLPGPRPEVISQKSHRTGYDHAIRNTGAKMVDVEGRQELEEAVNENTVLMFFNDRRNPEGKIKHEEFVELGKKHGIPTITDCAANIPPVENLWKFNEMGFDLVAFSGGKGLRGPQSTGLLFGRKDLIEAAKLNHSPNANTIGRGMKVNKEEYLAMLIAVERYVNLDHEEKWAEWRSQVHRIREIVESVSGVETEYFTQEVANPAPSLRITWDQSKVSITPSEVTKQLKEGHPSIEIGGGSGSLEVSTWMMRDEEVEFVGRRIREILEGTAS